MQINIDPHSDVPLYQQLRDRVVEGIASRRLLPGEQLASVRQLAIAFGINVATVSKGYDLLRQEGLIRTNHKSGSVIARGPDSGAPAEGFYDDWLTRLTTLLAEATAQGLRPAQISESVDRVLREFTRHSEGDRA
ncbi:MAG: GntR family transcriptional regulator [Microbacteriaceae bacterium]